MDRRYIFAGLLLVAGVGIAKLFRSRPRIYPNGRTRLLLIGDSHAQGLDAHLKLLAREAKAPYDAVWKVGTRIDQWASGAQAAALKAKLNEFQPTMILVSLGTNDAYAAPSWIHRDQLEMKELLETLATFSNRYENGSTELSYGLGADVVWVGPPKLPPRSLSGSPLQQELLDWLRSAAPNYFDTATMDVPMGPDGIHPSARGYAGWAGALWSHLEAD